MLNEIQKTLIELAKDLFIDGADQNGNPGVMHHIIRHAALNDAQGSTLENLFCSLGRVRMEQSCQYVSNEQLWTPCSIRTRLNSRALVSMFFPSLLKMPIPK